MTERVDLYDRGYAHFTDAVMAAIRKETFDTDIGQNSWITAEEFDSLLAHLAIAPDHHVLEVASGSGGPALHLSRSLNCRVTGIDANPVAVRTASEAAARSDRSSHLSFRVADANAPLPFDANAFDALVCIDSFNHLPDRAAVLREWSRVLRPGRRALFTDPVVITGPVTNEELAIRASVGAFLFVPPGINESLVGRAGLRLISTQDVSENAAQIAARWHRARASHKQELHEIEGAERFDGLQRFFEAVETLTSQRRLSRIAYLVEKPGA